jgi:branched-chain amino acid transport system permease protein
LSVTAVTALLSGLAYGMLLFVVALGLTLSFGLMRVVNLAHGAFYLLGGYVTLALIARGNVPFWAAVAAAASATAVLGALLGTALLRRFAGDETGQIVFTLGVGYIVGDLLSWAFGADPQTLPRPPGLEGTVALFGGRFPLYRLALIGFGATLFGGLELLFVRTWLGLAIRAAVDDPAMARSVGVRVTVLYTATFALGAALAALAGGVGAPLLGLAPSSGFEILMLALVVVVAGGLGSIRGSFLCAVLVGLIQQFGTLYFPGFALFLTFVPVALLLAVRPRGLFGHA